MSNVSGPSGSQGPQQNQNVGDTQAPQGQTNESDVQRMKEGLEGQEKQEGKLLKEGGAMNDALGRGADRDALTGRNLVRDAVAGEAMAGQLAGAQGQGSGVQVGNVGQVQGAASTSNVQEMATLANEMTSQILTSDARHNLRSGGEVRMTLSDANPNLKGTEVVLTRNGDDLNIQFKTTTPDAANYIAQNQASLNNTLKNDLTDVANINIEMGAEGDDSGGGDRESQGEYIADESESEEA